MSITESQDSTDLAWEQWGRRDPYFGVITLPQFRRQAMTEAARGEFFESGQVHVRFVLDYIRHFIDAHFAPRRVLDFGCGVGRALLAFAAAAPQVTGVDISPSMLKEARRNCDRQQLANVQLLLSDDQLSHVTGTFDLIHSCIVLQHIPVARGRRLLTRLLALLQPGGVGAVQVTYGKAQYTDNYGAAAVETAPVSPKAEATAARSIAASEGNSDPEMQMNAYPMNQILFLLHQSGIRRMHVEFTDHAGELGVFMFFQKPLEPVENARASP
jgi:2-polyprenyl-3-methyl-5-hydroxy-6-metoxy-1,4-benzoquinol methylase